jgi:hypothetical protein
MSFTYYVVDLLEGKIYGTDDEELATEISTSSEHVVIDADEGLWLAEEAQPTEIEGIPEGYWVNP